MAGSGAVVQFSLGLIDLFWERSCKKDTRIFEGQKEEGGEIVTERFELTIPGPGPIIPGMQTTIQLDGAFEDDLLVEETFDYYAQDPGGYVWYLGGGVTNYICGDDDNLIEKTKDSAWRAGVNEALPGFIMPADLTIGFNYYQEFAEADALRCWFCGPCLPRPASGSKMTSECPCSLAAAY